MKDLLTDSRGRRHRYQPQSTGKRLTPQKRDLLWFAFLARHGPLPSTYLHQLTKTQWRSEKRAKERLTDLFNEAETPHGRPYLTRPLQQFRTIDSRYNALVYDLAPAALAALAGVGEADPERRVFGPWLHAHMVACITASIELTASARGIRYIAADEILTRAGAQLRYPTNLPSPYGQIDLIPDALFGLEYPTDNGPRIRFFMVEADRATEPLASSCVGRKSALRSFLQYEEYVGGGRYKEHLKLTAPLLVLNVVTDPKRQAKLLHLVKTRFSSSAPFQLFQPWESFGGAWRVPAANPGLLRNPWERARHEAVSIERP